MNLVYADGFALHVLDRGMGPAVMLVHGFPLDHRMWRSQVDVLASRFRVIAPDLRGLGDSKGAGRVTTMARMADDLAVILDELHVDEPVMLCALSMGGYVAFEFWRRHAVRLRGLVLMDTRAVPDSSEAAEQRRSNAHRVLIEGTSFLSQAMLPKLLGPTTVAQRPDIVEQTQRMIADADPAGVAAALLGMADRADSTVLLPEIDLPSMLIVGEHDAISPPEEMEQMAAAMPNARFRVIPGVGHMSPLESPEEVNDELLAFFEEA